MKSSEIKEENATKGREDGDNESKRARKGLGTYLRRGKKSVLFWEKKYHTGERRA